MSRVCAAPAALLFPQRTVCHACGVPLCAGEGLLCGACARSLAQCALLPEGAVNVPDRSVSYAVSAFAYEGAAAALVKALKFGADYTAALPLAEGMAAVYAAHPPLCGAELCAAVPVHPRRMRRRGYNQAAVLADAFAQITGIRRAPDVLTRVHHKRSQVGQGRAARRRNIAGAFAVSQPGAELIRGRKILLIDDVLTTGATAGECAETLLAAGAQAVLVLTAAYAL